MYKIPVSLTIAALLMCGCNEKPAEEKASAEPVKEQVQSIEKEAPVKNLYGVTEKAPESQRAPADAAIQANTAHVGTVIETMDAAGYTYAKVNEDGNVYWMAGPQSAIKVGDSISYIEQMMMQDFTSKSLGKTFDYLMFASTIVPSDKAATPAVAPIAKSGHACEDCDSDTKKAHAPEPQKQEAPAPIKVAKAADGYSIDELYAKKTDLNGKRIKLNAQVVKVSKNIMGKDWVHLQDGSGTDSSSDLTSTGLNTTVKVGDVVTVEGVLQTDVDFGYGYFFPVIVQESEFKTN